MLACREPVLLDAAHLRECRVQLRAVDLQRSPMQSGDYGGLSGRSLGQCSHLQGKHDRTHVVRTQAGVVCGQRLVRGHGVLLELFANLLVDLDAFKLPLEPGASIALHGLLPRVGQAIPFEPNGDE